MSASAKQLLRIWRIRLMQLERDDEKRRLPYRDAVKHLVSGLSRLKPDEEIDVVVVQESPLHARFINVRTGDVIGVIEADQATL